MTARIARSGPRQQGERTGRRGETLAALWRIAKGYPILAQCACTPGGEVDIAALKGDLLVCVEVSLVFVEVKARRTHAADIGALTSRSRGRIILAGQALASRWRMRHLRQGYDLVVASRSSAPLLQRDTWREGDRDEASSWRPMGGWSAADFVSAGRDREFR